MEYSAGRYEDVGGNCSGLESRREKASDDATRTPRSIMKLNIGGLPWTMGTYPPCRSSQVSNQSCCAAGAGAGAAFWLLRQRQRERDPAVSISKKKLIELGNVEFPQIFFPSASCFLLPVHPPFHISEIGQLFGICLISEVSKGRGRKAENRWNPSFRERKGICSRSTRQRDANWGQGRV
ncbi:uncharacterized protein An11g04330 [Aspergillus niger]|uniref:Contig An11c0160, genomic contig n=2 Tax=Aspergillus niger TaxID=5061 RepID=A2QW95_ASPNC|nr:uncharacterized protein An11g04330 [Aspergillus niger]CAK40665.1 unnamed protein product [Aspergillus niger]